MTISRTLIRSAAALAASACILSQSGQIKADETDYEALISEASTLYHEGEYAASAQRYTAAFEQTDSPGYGDLYDAACSAALAGKTDDALEFLRRSIEAGWENSAHMKSDPDLATLRTQKDRWSGLEAAITVSMRTRYGEAFNAQLAAELADIYRDDQGIRAEWRTLTEQYGNPLPDSINQGYMQRWHYTDSVCLVRMERIIAEHGWPKRSMVGHTGASSAFLVIQHAPLATQERYIPLLEAAVAEGEARAADLALMIDRILTRKDLPQRYGSQLRTDYATGQTVFFPIEDPANVNVRRDSVGLGPIEEYARRFGIEWELPKEE